MVRDGGRASAVVAHDMYARRRCTRTRNDPHLLVDESTTIHPTHFIGGFGGVLAASPHQQQLRHAGSGGGGSTYGRGCCWDGLDRNTWLVQV